VKNIAIFASGGGSNAEAIIQYFKDHHNIKVSLIISNKKNAYVLERAKNHSIPSIITTRDSFYRSEAILADLKKHKIDLIVLAGFLWLVPEYLIDAYPDRIINIHPALLPKYGGKGMYGHHVHQAVKDNNDPISGITIHLVNKDYDKGRHLLQATTLLSSTDSPEDIAAKVLKLEHRYFPQVIEHILNDA
jgi:phosphoribosylglycinamide formyltransferase-1